jgi:hypothetical protein
MLVSTLFERINYALRGVDDSTPTEGTPDANYWLSVANRKKDEFALDPLENWTSLFSLNAVETGTVATSGTTALTGTSTFFENFNAGDKILVDGETVRTIDTIVSDTSLTVTVAFTNTASGKTFTRSAVVQSGLQAYNLNTRFLRPSDDVYVTSTPSQRFDFHLLKPQLRDFVANPVYISGLNPQTLTFVDDILTGNQIIGGTITVGGYFLPKDMTAYADTVAIPDPNWLAMATAAEIAFNDVSYEDKFSDLNSKANSLYMAMKAANRRGTITNPRFIPTRVSRIRGSESV